MSIKQLEPASHLKITHSHYIKLYNVIIDTSDFPCFDDVQGVG